MSALFESTGDIWGVWLATSLGLTYFFKRTFRGLKFARVKTFHQSESGASYSLPYVLTFPFVILILALFLQASLILIAKIGTVYAGHAATRSFIVWQSAAGIEFKDVSIQVPFAEFCSKRAATIAMVPFASASQDHLKNLAEDNSGSLGNTIKIDSLLYARMYERFLKSANKNDKHQTHGIITDKKAGVKKDYIKRKFEYAAAAMKVETPDDMVRWNEDVEVKITYQVPFIVPATGKILGGTKQGNTYYRELKVTTKMPSEAANTVNGKIGIPYQPSLLMEAVN